MRQRELPAQLWERLVPSLGAGESPAGTLTIVAGLGHSTVWGVHVTATHFANASEQKKELSRKKVSRGGENYILTHELAQQSL